MATLRTARAPLFSCAHRRSGTLDQRPRAGTSRIGGARGVATSSRDAWQRARNVLCIRLDNLGDVLMTTPAIHALKATVAGRRLTLLTSRSGAQAAPFIPDIDEVLCFDAPW